MKISSISQYRLMRTPVPVSPTLLVPSSLAWGASPNYCITSALAATQVNYSCSSAIYGTGKDGAESQPCDAQVQPQQSPAGCRSLTSLSRDRMQTERSLTLPSSESKEIITSPQLPARKGCSVFILFILCCFLYICHKIKENYNIHKVVIKFYL